MNVQESIKIYLHNKMEKCVTHTRRKTLTKEKIQKHERSYHERHKLQNITNIIKDLNKHRNKKEDILKNTQISKDEKCSMSNKKQLNRLRGKKKDT